MQTLRWWRNRRRSRRLTGDSTGQATWGGVGGPSPMLGGPLLRWVAFLFLLDPSQLGSTVEYAFYPDVLDILSSFPDKPL
jgi:hypothetical protein